MRTLQPTSVQLQQPVGHSLAQVRQPFRHSANSLLLHTLAQCKLGRHWEGAGCYWKCQWHLRHNLAKPNLLQAAVVEQTVMCWRQLVPLLDCRAQLK